MRHSNSKARNDAGLLVQLRRAAELLFPPQGGRPRVLTEPVEDRDLEAVAVMAAFLVESDPHAAVDLMLWAEVSLPNPESTQFAAKDITAGDWVVHELAVLVTVSVRTDHLGFTTLAFDDDTEITVHSIRQFTVMQSPE